MDKQQLLNNIFENIKPLNFRRRLIFQRFCKYLVENELIEQSYVDKYTTEEFLYREYYEDYKMKIDKYNEIVDNYIRNNNEGEEFLEILRKIKLTDMKEEFEEEIKNMKEKK